MIPVVNDANKQHFYDILSKVRVEQAPKIEQMEISLTVISVQNQIFTQHVA